MFIGTIRSTETRTVEAAADSMSEARADILTQVPAGWTLTDAPATKKAGGEAVTVTAKLANWADMRDIEAEDMTALRALVPDGYQLISVRRV